MTVESANDRAAMLADGVDVVFGGSTFKGIFENAYVDVADIQDLRPTVLCETSNVPNIATGDSITVDGTGYTVAIPRPDGTGMTLLILGV